MALQWPEHLKLPETSTVRPPHLEISPSGVRRWLASVPYAHATQLTEALLEQAQTLNHYSLSGTQRAAVLTAYREPLAYLHEYLEHNLARKPQDSFCDRLGQLYQTLAIGQLQVLHDSLPTRTLWGGQNSSAQALAGAMLFQLEQIQLAMQYYAPCPLACRWFHALYQLAEVADWLEQPVPHPWQEQTFIRAGQLYQSYLLLILIDPYRFSPQEQHRLQQLLPQCAAQVELLPLTVPRPAVGHFWVDMTAEQALQAHAPLKAAIADAQRYRLLSTANLVQQLETQVRQSEPEQAAFLQRLARAWKLKPQRRTLRSRQQQVLLGTYGLSAIYPLLGGVALSEFSENPQDHDIQAVGAYGFQTLAISEPQRWRAEGRHTEGAQLYVPLPAPNLGVGQLVSLRTEAETLWQVGMVRWQRNLTAHQLSIGVQLLPGSPAPVALRYREQCYFALHLPGFQLLTAKGLYQMTRGLTLMQQPGQFQSIRADKLLEASGYYERFTYKTLENF